MSRIGGAQVAWAPFLDGSVVHCVTTGRLYSLNSSATRLWRCLISGVDPTASACAEAGELGVSLGEAEAQVRRFTRDLEEAGLWPRQRQPVARVRSIAAPCAATLDGCYDVNGVPVRLRCGPPRLALALTALLAPMRCGGDNAATRLDVWRGPAGYLLRRDGVLVGRFRNAPEARWGTVRALLAAGDRDWLAMLHASGVARGGSCLVISGDSGAGKSTLLAGLLVGGLDLVTDDVLPVEVGSGRVWPTRIAVSIKEGSWEMVGRLLPELTHAPISRFAGRRMRLFWPRAPLTVADERGLTAVALVFPTRDSGRSVRCRRIGPAEALARTGRGGSVLPANDEGMAEFLAWLLRVPAYELAYGALEDAVVAARALLDGMASATYPHRSAGSAEAWA